MRIFKVKEAVIINSKFEEKAVLNWLDDNQPEVKWGGTTAATMRGSRIEFPYYLLRSSYNCLGFDRIDSDITEDGYTVVNLDLIGRELPKKESPLQALYRLTQDKAVMEISHNYGNTFCDRKVTEIVLNGNIMTDEYYFELKRVINKLQCSSKFTVTIKY